MKAVRRRDTAAELAVRSAVHRRGYRYRIDQAPIAGVRTRADLLFARDRLAVFIDGCFWHGCPVHATAPKTNRDWWRTKLDRNKARDRAADDLLRGHGWKVLRIWEHVAPEEAADQVAHILEVLRTNRPK